ncbi:MAG: hypothetical protein Sapg2KO_23620 [Saprospiraceae bacterium]
MERRNFIQLTALSGIGTVLPVGTLLSACSKEGEETHSIAYKKLTFDLLKDWCDGMIKHQTLEPSDPSRHGMLVCPACEEVDARLMDAVYPFLHLAKATGEQKYLDAGIALFEWGENVSRPDGSWTNTLDPKSWNGITVFGAISLAEALHYHGDLLDENRRKRWTNRLSEAAAFVYKKFSIDTTNINYGMTTVYAMNLMGRVLDNPVYTERSKVLAQDAKAYFTKANQLLFGEVKPKRNVLSPKGLPGIDLGYNVEESLNNLVMYALHEEDEELLDLLKNSLNTHLEFMLPDGGWDNSWGTRQFKWTYWGSRTSDGCQPAFGMMAKYNPAFGTAAFRNTELLRRCTTDGLLHGGPHYVSHGIPPCIHHTFSHAKPLAAILDYWEHLPAINTQTPLPRTSNDGITYFEELDTSLFTRGDWCGTVTAYDAIYAPKIDCRQATGGALSILYHKKVGLLLTASMANYLMVEDYNQQPAPGKDIALTPRIETYQEGIWYTNLFDLAATIKSKDKNSVIEITANTQIKNEAQKVIEGTASNFELTYICSPEKMQIRAKTQQKISTKTAFILPLISPSGEEVVQVAINEITIQKPEGLVKIKANVPLKIMDVEKDRTFNMVPGVEAVPIMAFFKKQQNLVELSIQVV